MVYQMMLTNLSARLKEQSHKNTHCPFVCSDDVTDNVTYNSSTLQRLTWSYYGDSGNERGISFTLEICYAKFVTLLQRKL